MSSSSSRCSWPCSSCRVSIRSGSLRSRTLSFGSSELSRRVPFLAGDISLAGPLPRRSVVVAYRDIDRTVSELGPTRPGQGRATKPLLRNIDALRPLGGLILKPRLATAFGAAALAASALGFSMLRAHASGWTVPRGGSGEIARASRDLVFFGTGPRGFVEIASHVRPSRYMSALRRYRYTSAASKVDIVLRSAIPWSDTRLWDASTAHLGGPESEVSKAEIDAGRCIVPNAPYVLPSQPTRLDRSRLPDGSSEEIVWAYAPVPNGSGIDAEELITSRIHSFAPGFQDLIVHRESRPGPFFAALNATFVGGDVPGGKVDDPQRLTRSTLTFLPWRTPLHGVYMCLASTPPGAGVQGIGRWHAAASHSRASGRVDAGPRNRWRVRRASFEC